MNVRVVFVQFVFGDARFEELIFGDVGFVGQVDWVRCCREKCRRTAHALQRSSEMVVGQKIVKTQFVRVRWWRMAIHHTRVKS